MKLCNGGCNVVSDQFIIGKSSTLKAPGFGMDYGFDINIAMSDKLEKV